MMVLGTHPLPNELLIEIGRFASTWAAVEQTVALHAIELYNFKHGYKKFEWLRLDFKRLREKWLKICREALDPKFHKELELLNNRLANAATARGYALHGVWEVTKGDVWNTSGANGQDYLVAWFEQKTEMKRYTLPTNLDEFASQWTKLDLLRRDLLAFLNKAHFKPNLDDTFFEIT